MQSDDGVSVDRSAPTGWTDSLGTAFPGVRFASPGLFSTSPYGRECAGLAGRRSQVLHLEVDPRSHLRKQDSSMRLPLVGFEIPLAYSDDEAVVGQFEIAVSHAEIRPD
jgi:hypothetical protein